VPVPPISTTWSTPRPPVMGCAAAPQWVRTIIDQMVRAERLQPLQLSAEDEVATTVAPIALANFQATAIRLRCLAPARWSPAFSASTTTPSTAVSPRKPSVADSASEKPCGARVNAFGPRDHQLAGAAIHAIARPQTRKPSTGHVARRAIDPVWEEDGHVPCRRTETFPRPRQRQAPLAPSVIGMRPSFAACVRPRAYSHDS